MSPEKVTIIDRDGWDPIGSRKVSERQKIKAKKHIVDCYKKIGIFLNLDEITYIKI